MKNKISDAEILDYAKETAIIYIEQISGIPYRYADDYELIEEEE